MELQRRHKLLSYVQADSGDWPKSPKVVAAQAMELLLEQQTKALGNSNAALAITCMELAGLYRAMGRFQDAMIMNERQLAIQGKARDASTLGKHAASHTTSHDHTPWAVAVAKISLANSTNDEAMKQGHPKKPTPSSIALGKRALELGQDALKILEAVCDPNDL